MSTTLTYGLILAFVNIVLSLVGYFLGYQTDKMADGRWFQMLFYASVIVVTWLGLRTIREEAPDKSLSFGRGVGSGVMIALYGGLAGAIYTFIHFKFVNPNFTDYLIDMVKTQQAAKGVPDAQLEKMEQGMRFIYGPVMMTIITPIFYVCVGAVVSLIVAAFVKRAPAPGAVQAS